MQQKISKSQYFAKYLGTSFLMYSTGICIWGVRSHAVACGRLCARLKHLRCAKKSTSCLIKKASRRAADCTSKATFFIFHSVKHKNIKRKSCIFICYFIGSVVKIVLLEAATRGVLYKKVFLKFAKFRGKYKCQGLFFNCRRCGIFTYRLNLKIFEHSL